MRETNYAVPFISCGSQPHKHNIHKSQPLLVTYIRSILEFNIPVPPIRSKIISKVSVSAHSEPIAGKEAGMKRLLMDKILNL